eukprot:13266436-Alexandrium_andersonii.AAC.1
MADCRSRWIGAPTALFVDCGRHLGHRAMSKIPAWQLSWVKATMGLSSSVGKAGSGTSTKLNGVVV